MFKLSIATTYTNPEERMDPWKEALTCYNDLADEVVRTGENWPYEFSWDYIGKTFNESYELATGDWVIRMDLDYFFHENDFQGIRKVLSENFDKPAVAFPKVQFFTPERYALKTNIVIAYNKKNFPEIKLNGGGDLCLPTLNDKEILPDEVPISKIWLWNYDSMFKTKEVIAEDRSRFARAWYRHFKDWGNEEGEDLEKAYHTWITMVEGRYRKHTKTINKKRHPKYIADKILNLDQSQFGYNAFGLRDKLHGNLYKSIRNRLI
tara:strand:+ start:48 stop:839 length:792 start_codon:yes stop_codon:yes gene_type:complete